MQGWRSYGVVHALENFPQLSSRKRTLSYYWELDDKDPLLQPEEGTVQYINMGPDSLRIVCVVFIIGGPIIDRNLF